MLVAARGARGHKGGGAAKPAPLMSPATEARQARLVTDLRCVEVAADMSTAMTHLMLALEAAGGS